MIALGNIRFREILGSYLVHCVAVHVLIVFPVVAFVLFHTAICLLEEIGVDDILPMVVRLNICRPVLEIGDDGLNELLVGHGS